MKTGIYFCDCGGGISSKMDVEAICARLEQTPGAAYVERCEFLCSEEGKSALLDSLRAHRPERVVVAACSPREYESTFRGILAEAGINPFFLQMVNIREHVAWVTADAGVATGKAFTLLKAAVARVALHEALETAELEASGDAVVIGAGPGGMVCALSLAEAGRKVTLVEAGPALGGLPVRFEELYPAMECGPCLLEPLQAGLMHGPHAGQIEVLTLAEVKDVVGYHGNFTVSIHQRPRYVDERACIGCMECIPPCPARAPNPFDCGMDGRAAISMPFPGALPNVPYLDAAACMRGLGQACDACVEACPVEGAIQLDAAARTLERKAGAIVLATGASLYDPGRIPNLGYGEIPEVYTSLEFERMLAANGPTAGQIKTRAGTAPRAVAIVHCVGSLDDKHMPYCSGVCCGYAFKFNRLIEKKLPGTRVIHLYKEMVAPGKEEYANHQHARNNPHAVFRRYSDIERLRIAACEDGIEVRLDEDGAAPETFEVGMVVLCPAMVPTQASRELAALCELPLDRFGFFEQLHGRVHATASKRKGFYLVGSCQAPMDIQQTMTQARAASSYILAGLGEGRKLALEPMVAEVDPRRCSGCRLCRPVCPYRAIGDAVESHRSRVNAVLCQGCGACVAACPAGAITGRHFTSRQITAEVEAILS